MCTDYRVHWQTQQIDLNSGERCTCSIEYIIELQLLNTDI